VFKDLKISSRLFLSFALLILLMLSVGLLALNQSNILAELTDKMHKHPFTVSNTVRQVNIYILEMRSNLKDIILKKTEEIDSEVQEIDVLETQVQKSFEVLKERFLGDQQQIDRLIELFTEWQPIRDKIIRLKKAGQQEQAETLVMSGEGYQHYNQIKTAMIEIIDFADNKATEFLQAANAKKEEASLLIALAIALSILLGLTVAFTIARAITRPLNFTIEIADAVANGKLDNQIDVRGQNEISQLLTAFASMQDQLRIRIEEDKRIADEALRINQALDNVTTSVLIADTHDKIIYANKSVQRLFHQAEESIRRDLPHFQVNQLIGTSIEWLHQQTDDQPDTLEQSNAAHRTMLSLGHLKLDVNITPVINVHGEHLGSVTELRDRTAEMATEQEVNTVMFAASQGDFSQRINLKDKTGFFQSLGEVLNRTLDYNQQMIEELMRVFAAIARGDLSQTITHTYAGSLEQLKQDVNATVAILINVMNAIKQTADAASQGNFNQRITLEDKQGFFRTLSEVLNQILDYNQKMIEELMHVFSAIAKGDLSQTITQNYSGALEQLKNDVNATVTTLTNIMTTVKQTAESVNVAAEEIAEGNSNLSQRTEQQAASLEQTAASMEQMTSTVQQNTNNTQQAADLAAKAREYAQQGGEVVNAAVTAMGDINQSSNQVYDIIGVIDEIAFQTNLLALNAAVEAARAGEQGRGFAVVATEVRNLAQRSAAAAKEIKSLIQNSVNKVEEGSRLVNQSGTTLADIVTAVRKVNDIISEIASASQEQSSGIHQVNKAIIQMEEMTQQNAALVEQAAVSSACMKEQAENLKNHIAFFKTIEVMATPAVTPTPTTARMSKSRRSAIEAPKPITRIKKSLTPSEPQKGLEPQKNSVEVAAPKKETSKPVKNISRQPAHDHEWQDF